MTDPTLQPIPQPRRYVLINTAEEAAILGSDEEMLPEEADWFNSRYAARGEDMRWVPFARQGESEAA